MQENMTDTKLIELITAAMDAADMHGSFSNEAKQTKQELLNYVALEYSKKSKNFTHVPKTCVSDEHMPAQDGRVDETAGEMYKRLGIDGNLWAEEMHKVFPEACLDTLRSWCCSMIMAGHDHAALESLRTDGWQRVVNAAIGVVQADTYKHPVLSREDAVKAGVAELHDAVNALQATQAAKAPDDFIFIDETGQITDEIWDSVLERATPPGKE